MWSIKKSLVFGVLGGLGALQLVFLAPAFTETIPKTITATAPLSLNSSLQMSIPQADTDTDGYLSSEDWDTFNGKLSSLPLTTKGDLLVHDGSSLVRLPVGTDGQNLVANSAQASGLQWSTPADVDLSDVTGTLGVGNGGTGQTTETAAFDALAPTTTKGDIIIHNGSDNVRFPVCSDGDIIEADSAQATGWVCTTPAAGATWGSITGTLSAQTDLQNALDAKVAGPASATDNAIAIFDGTTGKTVQNQDVATIDTDNSRLFIGSGDHIMFNRTTNLSGGFIDFTTTPNQYRLSQASFGILLTVPGSNYLFQQSGATFNAPNGFLEVGGNSTSFGNFTIRGRNSSSLNFLPTNLTIRSGEASGTASEDGGDMVVQAGDSTSITSGSDGGDLTLRAGDSSNNNSGSVLIREGVGNVDGIVEIGDATAQNTHRLNISTQAAGANTATLTNSPTTGNPAIWIRININGTEYVMPAWTAP